MTLMLQPGGRTGYPLSRWLPMDGDKIDMEARNRVGVLVVEDAGVGRPAFHLGDGQGRFFGLYSMEFVAKKNIEAKRKEIEKGRKAKKDVRQQEKDRASLVGCQSSIDG